MQSYLAARYMSGPKAVAILARTVHKKKRRVPDLAGPLSSTAILMIEDDDGGWGNVHKGGGDEDEDMNDGVVEKDRGFKKRKITAPGQQEEGWSTVRESLKQENPHPPDDERPHVVEETVSASSAAGGLVTAAQMRKVQKSQDKNLVQAAEEIAVAQETIYRDASGRKIDTKAERAEVARKKRERGEQEAKKMEWGKGLVQRDEKERLRLQLEVETKRGLATYADDKDLNEEQKAKDRWNDPAATFLTNETSTGLKKPRYSGPPPLPNRFGIKPGCRWDAVDRGNGFEKKLFQKMNERKRTGVAGYQWSVDDM